MDKGGWCGSGRAELPSRSEVPVVLAEQRRLHGPHLLWEQGKGAVHAGVPSSPPQCAGNTARGYSGAGGWRPEGHHNHHHHHQLQQQQQPAGPMYSLHQMHQQQQHHPQQLHPPHGVPAWAPAALPWLPPPQQQQATQLPTPPQYQPYFPPAQQPLSAMLQPAAPGWAPALAHAAHVGWQPAATLPGIASRGFIFDPLTGAYVPAVPAAAASSYTATQAYPPTASSYPAGYQPPPTQYPNSKSG